MPTPAVTQKGVALDGFWDFHSNGFSHHSLVITEADAAGEKQEKDREELHGFTSLKLMTHTHSLRSQLPG